MVPTTFWQFVIANIVMPKVDGFPSRASRALVALIANAEAALIKAGRSKILQTNEYMMEMGGKVEICSGAELENNF